MYTNGRPGAQHEKPDDKKTRRWKREGNVGQEHVCPHSQPVNHAWEIRDNNPSGENWKNREVTIRSGHKRTGTDKWDVLQTACTRERAHSGGCYLPPCHWPLRERKKTAREKKRRIGNWNRRRFRNGLSWIRVFTRVSLGIIRANYIERKTDAAAGTCFCGTA